MSLTVDCLFNDFRISMWGLMRNPVKQPPPIIWFKAPEDSEQVYFCLEHIPQEAGIVYRLRQMSNLRHGRDAESVPPTSIALVNDLLGHVQTRLDERGYMRLAKDDMPMLLLAADRGPS